MSDTSSVDAFVDLVEERSALADVLEPHVGELRFLNPPAVWRCPCGHDFPNVHPTAARRLQAVHLADVVLAAVAPASSVAAGQGEVDRG